jgi:O-antigen ligase
MLGAGVLAVVVGAIAVQVGTGDWTVMLVLTGILAAPLLVLVALRWPYVFPYGLYVALVPFDNMLKIGGAGTLTKLLGMLAIVAVAAHAFFVRRATAPPRALWIWAAFLLWNVIGTMWSPDLPTALLFVQTMGSLVLLFAILTIAPIDEDGLRAVCAFVVVGGVAASLYGIYLLHESPQMAGDYGRLMINLGDRRIDPNHFANSLLAPIALSLVALTSSRRPAIIFASLVALGVLVGGVLVSLSRESLLGCLVIVAVVIAMSRHRLVGALITVPLVIAIPFFVPAIGQRMIEAFSTGGAGRTSLWRVALAEFAQHPIFGWGTSGAVDAYGANFLRVYQAHPVGGWVITPHNTPLHVAVELGVIGLALFIAAYVATLLMLNVVKRDDRLWDLRVALTAAFLALAFVGFFIDLASYKYVWLVFAAIAQLRTVVRLRAPVRAPAAVLEVPVARVPRRTALS